MTAGRGRRRIERMEQVDVGRGVPTVKRTVGKADGEVQLEGDQDTERSARHPRLLFSVWASSGKLCMEMPPLNNPPLLTLAQ